MVTFIPLNIGIDGRGANTYTRNKTILKSFRHTKWIHQLYEPSKSFVSGNASFQALSLQKLRAIHPLSLTHLS